MKQENNNQGRDQNIINNPGVVFINGQDKPDRPQNEQLLLQEMKDEIEYLLKTSLYSVVLISLGKQFQPEQVKPHRNANIKIGVKPPEPLLQDANILEIFNRSDIKGKLLILGEPGSGKTTLMLELAQAAIEYAERNSGFPIPILFNLASWQDSQQDISDWILNELLSKYFVSEDFGKQLLTDRRLLPLLDGLDEVRPEDQENCVKAINLWLQSDLRPQYLAICSRYEEYNNYKTRLELNSAILLKALTEEQIQKYLSDVGRVDFWSTLQNDSELLKLAQSPLWLSIILLSYGELSQDKWQLANSRGKRLELFLEAYVQQMFKREIAIEGNSVQQSYPNDEQTKYWLSYLAKKMKEESQKDFLIEKMQPHWISDQGAKVFYRISLGLTLGLVLGMTFLIAGGLIPENKVIEMPVAVKGLFGEKTELKQQEIEVFGSLFNLSSGFIAGLAGFVFGCFNQKLLTIKTIETLTWKLKRVITILIVCSAGGIGFGFLVSQSTPEPDSFWGAIAFGFMGLIVAIYIDAIILLGGGISHGLEIRKKIVPNQGILQSRNNAVVGGLTFAVVGALLGVVVLPGFGSISGLSNTGMNVASGILVGILTFGAVGALRFGGVTCIQHSVLRFVLWLKGLAPLNYRHFLDYCTKRQFLQCVGGRYQFMHKYLQDYFASIPVSNITKTAEGTDK